MTSLNHKRRASDRRRRHIIKQLLRQNGSGTVECPDCGMCWAPELGRPGCFKCPHC